MTLRLLLLLGLSILGLTPAGASDTTAPTIEVWKSARRPDAIGLTVPAMPAGSPGMEQGLDFEPYYVLLIKKDGSTEVFAKH
jgi:hypothetical protein